MIVHLRRTDREREQAQLNVSVQIPPLVVSTFLRIHLFQKAHHLFVTYKVISLVFTFAAPFFERSILDAQFIQSSWAKPSLRLYPLGLEAVLKNRDLCRFDCRYSWLFSLVILHSHQHLGRRQESLILNLNRSLKAFS